MMLCCGTGLASFDDSPPFQCPHPAQVPVTEQHNPSRNVFCQYPGHQDVCPDKYARRVMIFTFKPAFLQFRLSDSV
uniref:Uncharacterized protein n=1 Tax=Steinernema glaseri TaxID=37863 RepID=A0A1I7ZTP5_9BILA